MARDKALIAKLDDELEILNQHVVDALRRRRKWMLEHIADYAHHPLGTVLYDSAGKMVGTVTGYYLYPQHIHESPRAEMFVHYELDGGRSNTSSQTLFPASLLDAAEVAKQLRARADYLAGIGSQDR